MFLGNEKEYEKYSHSDVSTFSYIIVVSYLRFSADGFFANIASYSDWWE